MKHGRTRNKGDVGVNSKGRAYAIVCGCILRVSQFWLRDTTKREKSSKIAWRKTAMGTTTVSKISGEHSAPRYRQATRTPVLWGCQSTDRMTSLLSRTDHKAGRARDRGIGRKREEIIRESAGAGLEREEARDSTRKRVLPR